MKMIHYPPLTMTNDTQPTIINLREWQEELPVNGRPLFQKFLDDSSRPIAEKITESRMLECVELKSGICIRSNSYVGNVSFGDIQIIIKPKLIGTPLLTLFRYAYSFRNLKILTQSNLPVHHYGLQDIFIFQLIQEIKELLSRGLHRKYLRLSKELKSPRGKINLQKIAKQSGPIGERLPCIINPRNQDILHNRMLKSGLIFSANITNDALLRAECRRLSSVIGEDIQLIPLNFNTWKQVSRESNRLTIAYNPALAIIKILLESRGVALNQSRQNMHLPGFLFDMNSFFQALISRFLHENLEGFTILDEFSLRAMLSYVSGYNPKNRKSPTPRPDYVIKKDGKVISILDAKYRDLWEKPLPREMLYQLSIYALSGIGNNKSIILYPTLNPSASEAKIQIKNPVQDTFIGQVILRPVNLLELESLIKGTSTQNKQKRNAFAQKLAFGKYPS